MIYDLNFLRKGEQFPPKSEIERLQAYKINQKLADDEAWEALPAYKDRVLALLNNFDMSDRTVYLYGANYWSDFIQKMQELTFGTPPDINADGQDDAFASLFEATDFMSKAKEGVQDFFALGDWVTKLIETDKGWGFINVDPATWFPIVSRENVKDIKYHVLAWVATVGKNAYELHVQIHEKGKFTNRAFALKNYNEESFFVNRHNGRKVEYPTYELGEELVQSRTEFKIRTFNTGLTDFAVVTSANNARTRTVYGVSDFDSITDSIMEYNVRQTLKDAVLDKHAAPKMYGPDIEGDSNIGNYLSLNQGDAIPGYLVWDASMQSVETTINALKEDISNLSGLGSLLNSKTFGESQGYDALMIKLAPALMRSAGKKVILEKHLKKLASLLSGKHGEFIPIHEITVLWHDGIPTTESVRADIASKHLATGWSKKRVLMMDYGFDENTADAIIEEARLEAPVMPMFGITEQDPEDEKRR